MVSVWAIRNRRLHSVCQIESTSVRLNQVGTQLDAQCAQAKDAASKAGIASAGDAAQQARDVQAGGGGSNARQAAAQQNSDSDEEQSRAEAARRQRAEEQAAQQQVAGGQQKQTGQSRGDGKAGHSDANQAADQASDGTAEAGAASAGADSQGTRTSRQGGTADRRLRDPVADASDADSTAAAAAAQSAAAADTAEDAQHVRQSSTANAAVLPAAEKAEPVKKQPRHPQQADPQATRQSSGDADIADAGGHDSTKVGQAAKVQQQSQGSAQNPGREELSEDIDPEEAADHDDYRDAESQ